MLHGQHIQITQGGAAGGDFMTITHVPTGISRTAKPALGTGKEMHEKRHRMLREIEGELKPKGLDEYIWYVEKEK